MYLYLSPSPHYSRFFSLPLSCSIPSHGIKWSKMGLHKNSKPHRLLKYLAISSGVIVLSVLAPASAAVIAQEAVRGYFRKKRLDRIRFLRDLKNLQTRKLIRYRELGGGEVEITITKQGKGIALRYDIDTLQLKRPPKWDGRWRLIIFDIPSDKKQAREAFRKKLSELGVYPLQKSVFLTPYPCEKEIEFIATIFEIRQYILLLHVSAFEGEEKFRRRFNLR